MISIKKVAVTPIPENTGTILDSFNTSDNKHTNAPSIAAVEEKLEDKSDVGHTHTKSEISDFAHTHDDRYYTETEMNTKLGEKFNAANVKLLTGTATFDSNGLISKTLSYPSGFTQSNTIVVGLGFLVSGVYYFDSGSAIELSSSNITLRAAGGSSGVSTTYRLLLMKVS